MHKCICEIWDQRNTRLPVKPQSCHELQCGATKKPRLFSNLHYATPLAFLALLSLFLFSFLLLQVFLILVQAKVGLSEVILTFYQHCNSISLCESDWYLGGVGLTDVNIWIRSSEYFIKVSYQKGLYILHSGTDSDWEISAFLKH